MKKSEKSEYIKPVITASLIMLFLVIYKGFFSRTGAPSLLLGLADGASVAGILLLLAYFIRRLDNEGGLDGVTFLGFRIKAFFSRNPIDRDVSYQDYVNMKKRSDDPLMPVLAVGTAFFIAGLSFTLIFMSVK